MSSSDQINVESVPVCEALYASMKNEKGRWSRLSYNRVLRDDGVWIEYDVPGQNRSIFWVGVGRGYTPCRFHDISAQKLNDSVYQGGKVVAMARAIDNGAREGSLAAVRAALGIT